MCSDSAHEITKLLERIKQGDEKAMNKLTELIYDELRRMARSRMRRERPGHTWTSSDLVHEAFLKLNLDTIANKSENRKYFFGAAANAMSQALVDHARKKTVGVTCQSEQEGPFDKALQAVADQGLVALDLKDSIEVLAQLNPRQALTIKLRVFLELRNKEIAEVLEVSEKTVESDLNAARAFLHPEWSE